VSERNPQVLARGKHLEPGADPGVGVDQRLERPSVQRAGRRGRGRTAGGVGAGLEHLLASPLGVQGRVVEERPHLGLATAAGQHVELLLGPIVLAGET